MGSLLSNPITEPTPGFPYFLLYFSKRDIMRLALATSQVQHTVCSAVRHMWMCGVEKESRLNSVSYEIRFWNTLFNHSSYHICCILMKRVMCKIFMDLYEIGKKICLNKRRVIVLLCYCYCYCFHCVKAH